MEPQSIASAAAPSTSRSAAMSMIVMTAWGAVFQIAMVVLGHFNEFVRNNVFAAGGMAISLIFGALYARRAVDSTGAAAIGGGIVGGACALIGITVSVVLGDTEAMILLIGTASSFVTGLIGGVIGHVTRRRGR